MPVLRFDVCLSTTPNVRANIETGYRAEFHLCGQPDDSKRIDIQPIDIFGFFIKVFVLDVALV